MMRRLLVAAPILLALTASCERAPSDAQYGPSPKLPEPQRGLVPSMKIAEPASWGDQRPTVPAG